MSEKVDPKTIHRKKEYKELRDNLIRQLVNDKKDCKQNLDLVADYMDLWVTKRLLREDIFERGVKVECYTARGDLNYKKNESVTELTKINASMLKILQHLDISITANEDDADDEM